jgi:hypothetical protein
MARIMIPTMNGLVDISLDTALFHGLREPRYSTNSMLLATKGMIRNPLMEKLGNCHNVITESTAGLSVDRRQVGVQLMLPIGFLNKWQGRERKTRNNLAEAATFRARSHGVQGRR